MSTNNKTNVNLIKDKFLIKECQEFTKRLIEIGMSIDEISKVIKEYQRTYILLKNQGLPAEIMETFTTEVWWKSR